MARAVVVLLWVLIAAEVPLFLSEFLVLGALGRAEFDMDAGLYMEAYGGGPEALAALASLLSLAVYAVAGFLTLKWIYRVSRNAKIIAPDKTVSAGWAVGWYFVPVAAAFMPFKSMRETWQISHSPEAWREVRVPALLRWWWGLYLGSSIVGGLSARLDIRAATVGDMAMANLLAMLTTPISIALCLVLMRVVRRISVFQAALSPPATTTLTAAAPGLVSD